MSKEAFTATIELTENEAALETKTATPFDADDLPF